MFEGSYKNLLHHRLFITKALILESPHPLQWIEDKVEVLRLFLLSYLPAMEALLHLTDTGMCGKFWSGAHLQRKSRRRFDGRACHTWFGNLSGAPSFAWASQVGATGFCRAWQRWLIDCSFEGSVCHCGFWRIANSCSVADFLNLATVKVFTKWIGCAKLVLSVMRLLCCYHAGF